MNWLDLLIVGILAWTVFRAFSSGLIREVVTLIGLVAGIALSGAFYDDLSANLEFVIADPSTRQLVAFGAIFLGTTIAGYVISAVLRTAAALLFLGPIDKIGGAVFGLVKGFLLVQIVLIAVTIFPAQTSLAKAVAGSTLAPYFLRFTPTIKAMLPAEFQDPLGHLQKMAVDAALQGIATGMRPGGMPAMPGIPGMTPKQ